METGPNKSKETKKTDKKRAAEALSSATFAVDAKGTAEALVPRRPSKLDRAIADLVVPRSEPAAEKPQKPSSESAASGQAPEQSEPAATSQPERPARSPDSRVEQVLHSSAETKSDSDDEEDENENEQAPQQKPERREQLPPKTLYAGEIILNLSDDAPEQADEIPLHETIADQAGETAGGEAEPEPAVQTPAAPTAWRAQPQQQQHQQRYNRPPMTEAEILPEPAPPADAGHDAYPNAPIRHDIQPAVQLSPPVEVLSPNDPNRPVTRSEMEDELYRAEKAGQNRGVLTGLIVGGGYEHFKHRRREKKQASIIREQERKLKRSLEATALLQNETATPLTAPEQAAVPARAEQAEKPKSRAEKLLPVRKRFEQAKDEQLAVPPEHHIETSAWHSIEVDNKTGKAVENPEAFDYGREYKREKQKENIQRKADLQSAAGEVALVAAAIGGVSDGSHGPDTPDAKASSIPDASTHGTKQTSDESQQSQKDSKQPVTAQSVIQLLPWAVVLIVIVVILIVVL